MGVMNRAANPNNVRARQHKVAETPAASEPEAKDEKPTLFSEQSDSQDDSGAHKLFNARIIDFDEEGREDFSNLGELLIHLRETYPARLAGGALKGVKVTVPASAVANYLKEHGYSMSSGSYSLLEQGKTLPGDASRFFPLIFECLLVQPTSKYRALLVFQYLFDAAARSIGAEFASEVVQKAPAALKTLRQTVLQR